MSFDEKCYVLLKKIPRGKVTTYKELAKALDTKAYRAVGNAMRRNPHLIKVPCHRVVKTDGSIGGYVEGTQKKIMLLQKEGIMIKKGKVLDFERVLYCFES